MWLKKDYGKKQGPLGSFIYIALQNFEYFFKKINAQLLCITFSPGNDFKKYMIMMRYKPVHT